MERLVALVLVISSLAGYSLACNKGYVHTGWGQVEPVIVIPKPQLFPKLKHAFHEGKLLVDYHKIVGPSLKPLPYKKGVGFIGLGKHDGWGGHIGGLYNNHLGYGYGGEKFLGVKGEVGWGKKGFGVIGPVGPIGLHGHHGIGLGHTQHVHQQHVTVQHKGIPHIPHDPHLFHGKK